MFQYPTTDFVTARYYNAGSALANDPDPNVTPPVADRILTIPSHNFWYRQEILTAGYGGTSGTIRPWIYAADRALWMPAASTTQTLTASANAAFSPIGSRGKQFFVQLVANTGLTEMIYGLV